MNKFKKVAISLTIFASLALVGCDQGGNQSSSEVPFDVNNYQEVVDNETAKSWVKDSINLVKSLDGVKIKSNFKDIFMDFSQVIYANGEAGSSVNEENQSLKASFLETSKYYGLHEINPQWVNVSHNIKDLELILSKKGIAPNNEDIVSLSGATIDNYILNNKTYVDISEPNFHQFFPNLVFFAGEYETIDKAKETADKVPEKFVDPTPVFSNKDLPLIDKLNFIKDQDIEKIFDEIIKANDKSEKKFLTFKSDGKDLLINIDFDPITLANLVYDFLKSIGKNDEAAIAKHFLLDALVINALEFNLVIDKDKYPQMGAIDINFGLRLPHKNETTEKEDGYITGKILLESESKFNFNDAYVFTPDDIDKYQEYDLDMPDIKDWIPIDKIPGLVK